MKLTIEVWKEENDPKIYMKLLEGAEAGERLMVDGRANYSGGNPRLYRALDALLGEQGRSVRPST